MKISERDLNDFLSGSESMNFPLIGHITQNVPMKKMRGCRISTMPIQNTQTCSPQEFEYKWVLGESRSVTHSRRRLMSMTPQLRKMLRDSQFKRIERLEPRLFMSGCI